MLPEISPLHYISQESLRHSHLELIEINCKAGIKWVQLRVKDKDQSSLRSIAKEAREITSAFGCKLIINDNFEIAAVVKAEGVHLGREDESPTYARKHLGDNAIIGATINDISDLKRLSDSGNLDHVNYLGLGPLHDTKTKKRLSPVLGLSGVLDLIAKIRALKIALPIIVVGGVTQKDISELASVNASGIAVSGAISHADAPEIAAKDFIATIKEHTKWNLTAN